MYKPRKLSIHIKELLKKHNMTQNELARRTAIEPARLSELTNEKRKQINVDYIVKIAEELDITDLNEIMSLEFIEEDK